MLFSSFFPYIFKNQCLRKSTEEEGDWGLELWGMFTSHFFPREISPKI